MLVNIERTQRIMDREGLDGLVATTLENCFYLSGSWSEGIEQHPYDDEQYVVATRDDPASGFMALSLGALGQVFEGSIDLSRVIPFGVHYRELDVTVDLSADEEFIRRAAVARDTFKSGAEALFDAIQKAGLDHGVIGLDERGPNRDIARLLTERFPSLRIKPAFALFREIRMVKSPEERDRMVTALRGSEAAIRAIAESAAPGMTELDLFKVAQRAIVEADCLPLWSSVRFGRNAAFGTVSDSTVLSKPDYIWLDIGCTYRGYRSDIGRTLAVGDPSEKLRRYYDACKAGQDLAFKLLTPGRRIDDLFQQTVDMVRQSGIPEYKRRHVGHGIGIEWYELPRLVPGNDSEIELGAMMEVETPHYEIGFGATMLEDLVVVTDEGAHPFTELGRDLVVIG